MLMNGTAGERGPCTENVGMGSATFTDNMEAYRGQILQNLVVSFQPEPCGGLWGRSNNYQERIIQDP